MRIIHSKNDSIRKNYSTKYSFNKFENYSFKKFSFFWKIDYRPGLGHEHTIVRSQLLGKPKITDSAKLNTNKKMKEFAEESIK